MNNEQTSCAGMQRYTPRPVANRPGLDRLSYRIGAHGDFFEAMKARLSNFELTDTAGIEPAYPLLGLRTRSPDDPAIALIDAWAAIADVLTFYQERIANEGYLRTATERRSVFELGRLVGYLPQPGLAASAYLAFTLEDGFQTTVPRGTGVQSVPEPGQQPQIFETEGPFVARAEWNLLRPRCSRPQILTPESANAELYLKGVASNLRPGDRILLRFAGDTKPELYIVRRVEPDPAASRTRVEIRPWDGTAHPLPAASASLLPNLPGTQPEPAQPGAPRWFISDLENDGIRLPGRLVPRMSEVLAPGADALNQLLAAARPQIGPALYMAMANQRVTAPGTAEVYALRTSAAVFGHNAPLNRPLQDGNLGAPEEWRLDRWESFYLVATLAVESGAAIDLSLSDPSPSRPAGEAPAEPQQAGAQAAAEERPSPAEREPQLYLTIVLNDQLARIGPLLIDEGPYTPGGLPEEFGTVTVSVKTDRRVKRKRSTITLAFAKYFMTLSVKLDDKNNPSFSVSPAGDEVQILAQSSALAQYHIVGRVRQSLGRENPAVLWLDTAAPQITAESHVVIERPSRQGDGARELIFATAKDVGVGSRAEYGITARSTRITLDTRWLDTNDTFAVIREAAVYAQSEPLELADAPLDPLKYAIAGKRIELDRLCPGLEAGRCLIVAGERTDVRSSEAGERIPGIFGAELVRLAHSLHNYDPALPDEKRHTTLVLTSALGHSYKLDTVVIYGNVVCATHGATHDEVLGSGDAAIPFQRFVLARSPLTFLPAPTARGAASTLELRVDNVRWHAAESLAWSGPADRTYAATTDEAGQTQISFGDGIHGARPPTGAENITAVYRSGSGACGNLNAGQIRQLASRPLGVREATNPLPASGGADPESHDQARRNVPKALQSLDRLVSVLDYADFARGMAGIAKASAGLLSDRQRQVVHLTIAAPADAPIDPESQLYHNLCRALAQNGDPHMPVVVQPRELLMLFVEAAVRLHPDYLFEAVAPKISSALRERFGFDRRELGQDALLSEALATIQSIEGVAYADVDVFDAISERDLPLFAELTAASGGSAKLSLGTRLRRRERVAAALARPAPWQYTIRAGDRLKDVLARARISLGALCELNPWFAAWQENQALPAGEIIQLARHAPREYIAIEGDTLAFVAAWCGVTLDRLWALNGEFNAQLGRLPIANTASVQLPESATYLIAEGDTLAGIATRFGWRLSELYWRNPWVAEFKSQQALKGNQRLCIPIGAMYTPEEGATIEKIAASRDTSAQEIVSLNPALLGALALPSGACLRVEPQIAIAPAQLVALSAQVGETVVLREVQP